MSSKIPNPPGPCATDQCSAPIQSIRRGLPHQPEAHGFGQPRVPLPSLLARLLRHLCHHGACSAWVLSDSARSGPRPLPSMSSCDGTWKAVRAAWAADGIRPTQPKSVGSQELTSPAGGTTVAVMLCRADALALSSAAAAATSASVAISRASRACSDATPMPAALTQLRTSSAASALHNDARTPPPPAATCSRTRPHAARFGTTDGLRVVSVGARRVRCVWAPQNALKP